MELNEIKNEEFRTKGYIIVRNVLSPVEVETMRKHADAVAADLDAWNTHNAAERKKILARHTIPKFESDGKGEPLKKGVKQDLEDYPEIEITPAHARRENRVYPSRQFPVDSKEREATATKDPFSTFTGQINGLADDNEYFRSLAAHPNIIKVLNELLSPDIKLWFDHIYNKDR